jgi:hypothetical protein
MEFLGGMLVFIVGGHWNGVGRVTKNGFHHHFTGLPVFCGVFFPLFCAKAHHCTVILVTVARLSLSGLSVEGSRWQAAASVF